MFKLINFAVIFTNLWIRDTKIIHACLANENSDPSVNYVTQRYENIIRPPNDKRLYRGLILNNEMKVLLISDPTTNKCAASMTTGVGAIHDFRDVPGIANLVGYMLMMGSNQYPQFYHFNKFLRDRDGVLDASINLDNTTYSFEVSPDDFSESLKRFSYFFIEPLLQDVYADEIVDDAVQYLHSGYLSQSKEDYFRITEVEKSMSKQNHFYNHLYGGSEETLYQHTKDLPELPCKAKPDPKKVSLNEKVKQFHSMWYSSNIMSLAVLGKGSLNELEELVVSLFKSVENKKTKPYMFPYKYHPWGPDQLKNKIYIVPLDDKTQKLRLNFPIPDIRDQYRTAPETYVGYLITYEGPGSLTSTFRNNGLGDEVNMECHVSVGLGFCLITCSLTDEGMKHVDDIINLIFQYIYMLMSDGIQKQIFDELKEIQKLNSSYKYEDVSPITHVQELAMTMQTYSLDSVLTHEFFQNEWDASLIEEFLTYFRPNNMNVTMISKFFAEEADQVEKYYGANYKIEAIPNHLLEKWNTKELVPEFQVPPPNEFIPENFDLYPIADNEPKDPYIIHQSSISEVWFKQEDQFQIPWLCVKFEITGSAMRLGPFECSIWLLLERVMKFLLNETQYSSQSIGYTIESTQGNYEILITVDGFHDKLPILLKKVLSIVSDLENNIDEKKFKILQNQHLDHLENTLMKDHFSHSKWLIGCLLIPGGLSPNIIINITKMLQYGDMKKFLSRVFRRVFIRSFIHGNFSKEMALNIANIFEASFYKSSRLLLPEILQPRMIEIAGGSNFVYQLFNPKIITNGYSSYFPFQIEPISSDYVVLTLLLYEIIQNSFHEIVPEKSEEENPRVKCDLVELLQGIGFTIMTLSERDPRSVDSKLEKIMQYIPKMLSEMSDDRFERFKTTLLTREYKTPSHLSELSYIYWNEIQNRSYFFERKNLEIERLRLLKKADLLTFFKRMFDRSSSERRKLAIHMFPETLKQTKRAVPPAAIKIEDRNVFETNSTLLPLNFKLAPNSYQEGI